MIEVKINLDCETYLIREEENDIEKIIKKYVDLIKYYEGVQSTTYSFKLEDDRVLVLNTECFKRIHFVFTKYVPFSD